MSSTPASFNEEQQPRAAQKATMPADYTFSEEEKRILKECDRESFYSRSLPISVISMAITKVLIVRGTLSASPRFGSLPKMMFAGIFGFLYGKVSYMPTCVEKLKKLENSPIAEVLRQTTEKSPQYSKDSQSELSDPDTQSFDTMFQPTENQSHMSTHPRDYGYGYSPEPPGQMGRADDYSTPVTEEEEPKKKSILYEDLRLKNRENYEVTLIQKTDTLIKTPTESEPEIFKKERQLPPQRLKKNIYGDTWEE